jgi:NYN domain
VNLASGQPKPTANVYVDGFNLYYGALKNTPYKWLDLDALFRILLPSYQIQRIRYFTARVSGRAGNMQAPSRQNTYLRALRTLPNVTIHLGHFLTTEVRMPLAKPTSSGAKTVKVIKTEEKGSDVNLATYLLTDAMRHDSVAAVVVSNDSDLCEPIRFAQGEFGVPVGLLNPHRVPSQALLKLKPALVRPIRSGPLSASQFPPRMSDSHGKFFKPTAW